jgi:heme-degrading monooxygenase HmoA
MLHLAQFNIGRGRAPLDDPAMAEFVNALDQVNTAAEQSPGFVWRLKDDNGASSSYVRAYEDERMLISLSVWESIEAVRAFTYGEPHVLFFRRRAEWFEPHGGPNLVLWWIPAGHIPTVREAVERMEHLIANGPTAHAFTFKSAMAPPAASAHPSGS